MSLYPSPEALTEAVQHLSESRARPVLCDFLIAKYAMQLGGGTVTLSTRNDTFMTAVARLASAAPPDQSIATPEPYFVPFGASRARKNGWRTWKYPSNGPPDTLDGSNWTQVMDIFSRGPRQARFKADYVDHLAAIVTGSEGAYPRARDVAVWFFRFEDVEPLVGQGPDEGALIQPFEAQVGLTPSERAVIFGEH